MQTPTLITYLAAAMAAVSAITPPPYACYLRLPRTSKTARIETVTMLISRRVDNPQGRPCGAGLPFRIFRPPANGVSKLRFLFLRMVPNGDVTVLWYGKTHPRVLHNANRITGNAQEVESKAVLD